MVNLEALTAQIHIQCDRDEPTSHLRDPAVRIPLPARTRASHLRTDAEETIEIDPFQSDGRQLTLEF